MPSQKYSKKCFAFCLLFDCNSAWTGFLTKYSEFDVYKDNLLLEKWSSIARIFDLLRENQRLEHKIWSKQKTIDRKGKWKQFPFYDKKKKNEITESYVSYYFAAKYRLALQKLVTDNQIHGSPINSSVWKALADIELNPGP